MTDPVADLVRYAALHKVGAYDGSHLKLAVRLGAKLATLDRELRSAARRAGVELA